jgi:hypothetical protein
MFDWLKQRKLRSLRQPCRKSQALLLEPLEERALPSVTLPMDPGLDGGDLLSDEVFWSSTPTNKGALIAPNSSQISGNAGGQASVPVTGESGQTPDSAGALTAQFAAALGQMNQGNVGPIKSPAGPTAAPKPLANTPKLINSFQGLSNPTDSGFQPPDSQAAAGPTVVINTVNQTFGMYSKTGTKLATVNANTFFNSLPAGGATPGGGFSDPVVSYDDNSGRFFLSDQNVNTTLGTSVQDLAVSKSSAPTTFTSSDWTFFEWNTGEVGPNLWADYPGKLGFNADVIAITLNMFTPNPGATFQHAQVNILSKSFLLSNAGGLITVGANLNQFDDTNGFFTLSPASMHASVSGDAMIFLTNPQTYNSVNVVRLPNPLTSNASNFGITSIPVTAFAAAVGERLNTYTVPGTGSPDTRMLSAATRNGELVGAMTVGNAGRDECRWLEINISGTPTLNQEGDIFSVMAGGDTYYPGIDIDPRMDLGVSFIESVGTHGSVGGQFPSMYVTGRTPSDAAGTMETPLLVFAGTADGTGARGGDMSTMAIDPTNGTFWGCNEFVATANGWNQGIANFSIGSPTQATGVFFIDGINQLWLFQNGKFTNTGGFASQFSAGVDQSGNPECWFLDGINQLWKWDNGVFTNTGGFAQHIAAGFGFVAFSDGINQLWTFTDGGTGFKNTGGFASRFTAGWSTAGVNQVDFADGINQLWTYNVGTGVFTNTGGFTKLFVAGQDAAGNNEIWFTDGNNQIWRLTGTTFKQTSGFALTITGAAGGQMYFSDGINQIWNLTDAGVFTNTGGFASHISSSPGTTALFFSDGINQLWQFQNATFTNTGGFASKFSAF